TSVGPDPSIRHRSRAASRGRKRSCVACVDMGSCGDSGYSGIFSGGPGRTMKIGRQEHRSSALSTSHADTIIVRGKDLCQDLIGKVGFTDYVWFLLCGALPEPAQRRVLDATLVAIAEHGLVPSVQAARMTYAAAPEALQGAVSAGLLGCGSVILGAAESAGRLLADVVTRSAASDLEAAARAVVGEKRA